MTSPLLQNVPVPDQPTKLCPAVAGAQPSHQEQQQTYLLLFAVLHTLLREDWGSTPLLKELAKYAADPALTGALGPGGHPAGSWG
jgi:hypothetical protein